MAGRPACWPFYTAELEELAADQEGLRAAVRVAVEAELEPLHELTGLLRRLADGARTTGHALQGVPPLGGVSIWVDICRLAFQAEWTPG